MVKFLTRYFWNVLLWLDQGINVILFAGDPDETVSSHAGKEAAKGRRWACVLCRLLDKLDRRHCASNIEQDEGRDAALRRIDDPEPLWRFWLAVMAAGGLVGSILAYQDAYAADFRSSGATTLCCDHRTMLRPDFAILAPLRPDRGV